MTTALMGHRDKPGGDDKLLKLLITLSRTAVGQSRS
jgi:hypothetical protein